MTINIKDFPKRYDAIQLVNIDDTTEIVDTLRHLGVHVVTTYGKHVGYFPKDNDAYVAGTQSDDILPQYNFTDADSFLKCVKELQRQKQEG